MAKKKGIERTKTDKSIKADHKGQNIIQTVRVVVQAPKEPAKRKRKSKSKSSSKGSGSVSKKDAIAELQTVMTQFRALKDRAQKMGIKLPVSIGESSFIPADIKTVADIQGLTAELRVKNSQIEALLQSPAQSGLGAQLPQQASSFAPQIVEKSEPAKVPTPVPQVSPSTGPPSDKDIDDILNSVPKVSDEDIDKTIEKATGQAPTGSVVQDEMKVATSEIVSEQGNATTTVVDGQQVIIKLNQLKDQARNANTLEVQKVLAQQIGYDLGTKDRGTISGELKNNLETLPVDSLDDAYVYFKTSILLDQRGNMGTISQNVHDKILKALKMITNVTYNNQFTDLKGYHQLLVDTDFADVEELPPDLSGIAPRTNPSDRPTIREEIAEQERENKISLAKMAADKANEEAKAKQEETRKEQEQAVKDDIKSQLSENEAKRTETEAEFKADLTGNVDEIIKDEGLEAGPKVVKEAIDKLESIEIVAQSNNQDILKLLRVISEEADDVQRKTPIQPEIVEKIKTAYRSVTMKEYTDTLTTYGDVSGVLNSVKEHMANEGKVQDVAKPEEVDHIIETFDDPIGVQFAIREGNRVEFHETEQKPIFRSLQKFLGATDASYNEFTYLQMIGSLKDKDIVFTTDPKSLSQRKPTGLVITNVNKFLKKLAEESGTPSPDLEVASDSYFYSDLIASVQSKVKAIDAELKKSEKANPESERRSALPGMGMFSGGMGGGIPGLLN